MKAFIALLLCAVAVAHPMTYRDRVKQFSRECMMESNVDPDYTNNGDSKTKRPSIQEVNCVLACVDKKLGLMSQDGTYDKKALLNSEMTEVVLKLDSEVEELIQKCKSHVGNDYCKMAACVEGMPPNHWQ